MLWVDVHEDGQHPQGAYSLNVNLHRHLQLNTVSGICMSRTDPGVPAGQGRARSPGGVLLGLVERFHRTARFAVCHSFFTCLQFNVAHSKCDSIWFTCLKVVA